MMVSLCQSKEMRLEMFAVPERKQKRKIKLRNVACMVDCIHQRLHDAGSDDWTLPMISVA